MEGIDRAVWVTDREAFLDYCWEVGWLDERFGDDPAVDPEPQEVLGNLLLAGFVEIRGVTLVEEETGSPVPGVSSSGDTVRDVT